MVGVALTADYQKSTRKLVFLLCIINASLQCGISSHKDAGHSVSLQVRDIEAWRPSRTPSLVPVAEDQLGSIHSSHKVRQQNIRRVDTTGVELKSPIRASTES